MVVTANTHREIHNSPYPVLAAIAQFEMIAFIHDIQLPLS